MRVVVVSQLAAALLVLRTSTLSRGDAAAATDGWGARLADEVAVRSRGGR